MTNTTKLREIELNEIKTILLDPLKLLAICSLSDSYHITTNGQSDGLIEVIEEITLSNNTHETLSDWIDKEIVHFASEKTADDVLATSQFCDIWRDCYISQPLDAVALSSELGLV
tara:strand:- start:10392 stop:10736 length:345 start_codon:yes stop_codon:yes gene_type:complete